MNSQPRGDTGWDAVLAHRPPETREAIRERLESAGVTPDQLAAALIAAEVGALTAHLTSRASAVRAVAVEALLDDYSAVAVASRLGVSRQKVYDIARPGATASYLDRAPWRS